MFYRPILCVQLFFDTLRQVFRINITEIVETGLAMCVQSGTIVMQFANDTGEIEIQYQVAVPVTCKILPYVEVSKQGVEFILGSYIIVMLQHIQRQTFAETTRTDKEKITV